MYSQGNRGKIGTMFSEISNMRWQRKKRKDHYDKRHLTEDESLDIALEERT
jgi:hypothetical protein